MITRTTRRITSTVSVVQVVLVRLVLPSPSSPPRVSICVILSSPLLTFDIDSKQARDLVNILTEAKQQIDPRLQEMCRYGGGGGGGGRWGGGRGRGGRGGGGGRGGWSGGNGDPIRNSRW